ncbi:MAG: immunoglobulin-like domain-containing protein [Eubacteriales bacterium]
MRGKVKNLRRIMIIFGLIFMLAIGILVYLLFFYNKLHKLVTIEAGSESIAVSEFIKNEKNQGIFQTDMSTINMNEPGVYEIKIQIGKRVYSCQLEIIDTISPAGEAVNHEIWADEALDPDEFVTNITDATEVEVLFIEQPNFSEAGTQEVLLMMKDTSGNQTELTASLTIKVDIEPPSIDGADNQTVYVDDKISYKKGVVVKDNRDESVDLEIDSHAVNLKKAGTYKVAYSATDKAGNTSTKTVTITVKEKPKNYVSQDELNKLCDEVLTGIIKEDMSDIDKAWAIYKWTRKHIAYTGSSDKSSWMKGAVQGITKGTGDCFTYYATARALLTRSGFENMRVTRVGGATQHFWNLIKIGGSWYHYDAGLSRRGYYYVCFLRTDAEVEEYSKTCVGYYKFDKSKYPATPTEILQFNRTL